MELRSAYSKKVLKEAKLSLKEAFPVGSYARVLDLIESYLQKRVSSFVICREFYTTNKVDGKDCRTYTGAFKKGSSLQYLRINFLLGDSEYISSIGLYSDYNTKHIMSYVYDEFVSSVRILPEMEELITGRFKEDVKESTLKKSDSVNLWLNFLGMKGIEDLIKVEWKDIQRKYIDYMKENYPDEPLASMETVKLVLNQEFRNLNLKHFRARRGRAKKNVSVVEIKNTEETKLENQVKPAQKELLDWRDLWKTLEFNYNFVLKRPNSFPYGLMLFGSGGTGKSFWILENLKKDGYDSYIRTGHANLDELVKILYRNKDKDVIVFDDADSVINNKNFVNILKGCMDSTGDRKVVLPKLTGAMKDIARDLQVDENGDKYFILNASMIIISNLKGIKEKALESRFELVPIFMTREEIVERLGEILKIEGITPQERRKLTAFFIYVVENFKGEIKNDMFSGRTLVMVGESMVFAREMGMTDDTWQNSFFVRFGLKGIRTSLPK